MTDTGERIRPSNFGNKSAHLYITYFIHSAFGSVLGELRAERQNVPPGRIKLFPKMKKHCSRLKEWISFMLHWSKCYKKPNSVLSLVKKQNLGENEWYCIEDIFICVLWAFSYSLALGGTMWKTFFRYYILLGWPWPKFAWDSSGLCLLS